MSTSLEFAGKLTLTYGGGLVYFAGILGGMLNTIVFLSLRTFRQSSCAFYLLIMSIVNVGQLFTILLSRISISINNTDGTDTSLFYCKFRLFFTQLCTATSLTCFCLATIDQYCATSSRLRLQQFCNIKLARYLVTIVILIWISHGIPYLVLFEHVVTPLTNITSCTMTNTLYVQYRTYFVVIVLYGFLPCSIALIFGMMAYYNTQQLAHYTVPLVRRELDKQLTVMVLMQVVVSCFALLPYTIMNVLQFNTYLNSDTVIKAKVQLSYYITQVVSSLYFASPLYIYICVSERFRRQLTYVLYKIHRERCRRRLRIVNIQVVPQTL